MNNNDKPTDGKPLQICSRSLADLLERKTPQQAIDSINYYIRRLERLQHKPIKRGKCKIPNSIRPYNLCRILTKDEAVFVACRYDGSEKKRMLDFIAKLERCEIKDKYEIQEIPTPTPKKTPSDSNPIKVVVDKMTVTIYVPRMLRKLPTVKFVYLP